MKAILAALGSLLLFGTVAVASDEGSKTFERPDGDLTVSWGPAPTPPSQGRPDFDELDANADERLSLAETESHRLLHSDFIFADGNRNGYVSRAELERWN